MANFYADPSGTILDLTDKTAFLIVLSKSLLRQGVDTRKFLKIVSDELSNDRTQGSVQFPQDALRPNPGISSQILIQENDGKRSPSNSQAQLPLSTPTIQPEDPRKDLRDDVYVKPKNYASHGTQTADSNISLEHPSHTLHETCLGIILGDNTDDWTRIVPSDDEFQGAQSKPLPRSSFSNLNQISTWGNIQHAKKWRHDSNPNKTYVWDELSEHAKVLTVTWTLLGGAANSLYRRWQGFETWLRKVLQLERYSYIVEVLRKPRDTKAQALDSIVDLIRKFLNKEYYTSATARLQSFAREINAIYFFIGEEYRFDNAFERNQNDMPYPYQRVIMDLLVKVQEKAVHELVRKYIPTSLLELETMFVGCFELCSDTWDFLLPKLEADSRFQKHEINKLDQGVTDSIHIRNLAFHRTRVTTAYMSTFSQSVRGLIETCRNLIGHTEGRWSSELLLEILSDELDRWGVWSSGNLSDWFWKQLKLYKGARSESEKEEAAMMVDKEQSSERDREGRGFAMNILALFCGKPYQRYKFPENNNSGINAFQDLEASEFMVPDSPKHIQPVMKRRRDDNQDDTGPPRKKREGDSGKNRNSGNLESRNSGRHNVQRPGWRVEKNAGGGGNHYRGKGVYGGRGKSKGKGRR